MASDRVCAICGAAIGIAELEVGSSSERAKRFRKDMIEVGLREHDSYDKREKRVWKEVIEVGIHERECYDHGYDPEVMESRDATLPNHARFIDHVRLVICDPDIKSGSKCFISGPAKADSFGWGTMDGGHPERPNEEFENVMYITFEDDQTKAFPCHGLCLQIAAKVILGSPDSKLLNPEVLYGAMCDVHEEDEPCLNLNYGDVHVLDQYWDCKVGEEFCVMNPLEFYDLHMQTLVNLTVEKPKGQCDSLVGTQKTIADPFRTLSNELIHHITSYLDGKELFLLRRASMIVREATNGKSFWMPRVQKDMGWLWVHPELFALGNATRLNPPIDWMKVYLLFNTVTARPWGMRGVYMGLANRRRIWNVCEDIKSLYMSHVAGSGKPLINPDYSRSTWGSGSEIDSLWSEASGTLGSYEQWLRKRH